jgi:hypothetical protein
LAAELGALDAKFLTTGSLFWEVGAGSDALLT